MITYDARGNGDSTRTGPYDMATDVDDLLVLLEERHRRAGGAGRHGRRHATA